MQRFALWRAVVFFGLLVVGISSCQKDRLIGLEVQPDGYLDSLTLIDSFTVEAYTFKSAPQISTRYQNFIGRLQNDAFGMSTAKLFVNFSLESENIFLVQSASNFTVEEVTLTLFPLVAYGDPSDSLTIDIYQTEQALSIDSNYTSERDFAYDDSPLGSMTIAFENNDSIGALYSVDPEDSNAVPFEGLKVNLDHDLGSYLLQGIGTYYTNSSDLLEYFHGLTFVPRYEDASADGAIYNFDLTTAGAGLAVTYSYAPLDNPDSTVIETLDFPVRNTNTRFNQFDLDYSGGMVEQALNDKNSSEIYVQGMSGTKAAIDIPYLNAFAEKTDVAISRAELIIPVSDLQPSALERSERLFLLDYEIDPTTGDTVESLTLDYAFNSLRYGGVYDEDAGEYSFDVTREIQEIIEAVQRGEDRNFGFTLNAQVPVLNGNIPNQNVLAGSDNIVLKLFFTDLSE